MSFARNSLVAAAMMLASAGGASAQENGRLDRIRATRSINLGYPEASPPFAYLDDQQNPTGYSIEICKRVVDRIKASTGVPDLAISFTPVSSATRIPLLANGTIDLECGKTTNLTDRHKLVSFAPTTFVSDVVLVARKGNGNDVNDPATFRGKSIAAVAGGQTFRLLSQLNARAKLGISVMTAKDTGEAFLMLETGRAQAVISEDALAYAAIATSKTPDLFAIGTKGLELAPYGILEPKDDPSFKAVVDTAILELIRSGQIEALYTTYFETPALPRGVNLKFPMSAALKRSLAKPTDSGDPAAYEQLFAD